MAGGTFAKMMSSIHSLWVARLAFPLSVLSDLVVQFYIKPQPHLLPNIDRLPSPVLFSKTVLRMCFHDLLIWAHVNSSSPMTSLIFECLWAFDTLHMASKTPLCVFCLLFCFLLFLVLWQMFQKLFSPLPPILLAPGAWIFLQSTAESWAPESDHLCPNSLIICVSLGKLLNVSKPQVIHPKKQKATIVINSF